MTTSNTKTPDFKRPNHTDFMDSSELKKLEFSGIRHNNLIQTMEIWVLGEVKGSLPDHEVMLYPEKFNALYADIFGLNEVKVDGVDAKPRVDSLSNLILPN